MINKFKTVAKSLINLRRILSNKIIFQILRKNLSTEFVNDLKYDRILILSPHPDDEVIGCGGALIKSTKDEENISKVIHFTDGSEGFPEDFKPSQSEKRAMSKTRENEATEVKDKLGINEVIFLRYKDGKLSSTKNLVNYMRQAIKDFSPDAVFVPSFLDPNSDHYETARIFYLSSKNLPDETAVFQYEVWSPIFANCFLNIDDVMEEKLVAIKVYQSQLKSRDYSKAIEGLNTYRGTIFGKSKNAEAYLRTDLKTFRQLSNLIF